MKHILLLMLPALFYSSYAQTESNSGLIPDLVRTWDSTEFKPIVVTKNGFMRSYLVADPDISFISGASKSRIDLPGSYLISLEGNLVNGQRKGVFTTYLYDNGDHKKRYKIYEQDYKNDLIDGHWKAYDLNGTLKYDLVFVKGRQAGHSVYYAADGKTINQTCTYLNDSVAVVTRYDDNGKKQQVQQMVNGIQNGPGTVYYPNGNVETTANFVNGQFSDTLKYYYPNGNLWTMEIFKNGLDWAVLCNYDSTGKPRDAGTLKNGNGTRILYTEDGDIRQVVDYVKGVPKY